MSSSTEAGLQKVEVCTLTEAADALAKGEVTSRSLVERCLERMEHNPNARAAYTSSFSIDRVRQYADAADLIRAKGYEASPWAGIPISVKDLFDLRGQRTLAGSRVFGRRPAADSDAAAIAPLRSAGLILFGRTQMTEFAYSGLGLNPHSPQPVNTMIDDVAAVPGGSSSGGAVSVATGAALGSIGSDTGGSCRIPAAFNGLTGFKPTAGRISRKGMIPLSPAFDGVGVMAHRVADCSALVSLMEGRDKEWKAPEPETEPVTLLFPTNYVRQDADAQILAVFEAAISHLERNGITIIRKPLPMLQEVSELALQPQIVAAEAYHYFHDELIKHPNAFDPRVRERMLAGETITVPTLRALYIERQKCCARFAAETSPYNAIICPTVLIQPPSIEACKDSETYAKYNRLALRNPSIANLIDGCSISLPMHWKGLPAGLMLTAVHCRDKALMRLARLCEIYISGH